MELVVQFGELQQRTNEVEAHLHDAMEKNRARNERLSNQLDMIEESFVRNESEIRRLREEQIRDREENEQLRAMLRTLLATIEGAGVDDSGNALHEMEERVNSLIEMESRVADTPDEDFLQRSNSPMFKSVNELNRWDWREDAAVN